MNDSGWHILGAGSIGCLWAAKLYQSGIQATLIVRPHRFQQLNSPTSVPLKITDISGKQTEIPVKVSTAANIKEPISKLIVTTKAQHARDAVTSVQSSLTGNSRLLLLQNGMGSQQNIARDLPEQEIWAGSSTDGAFLTAPFHVNQAGQGITRIGKLTNSYSQMPIAKEKRFAPPNPMKNGEAKGFSRQKTDVQKQGSVFSSLLNNFALRVEKTENIEEALWQKLAINCCINGLTALYRCKNGELLTDATRANHLLRLIEETTGILAATDVNLNSPLKKSVIQVCQGTAENYSSTYQDAKSKKTTELEYINGFLIRQAHLKGLSATEHSLLLARLKEQGVKF